MKGIFVCSCGGMKDKAEKAFKIMFPRAEVPTIYRGEAAISRAASKYPNTNVYTYLTAIAKTNGRYAYYVASDEQGNVTENYNLLTGKQVA